jgi:hypothetical protein
MTSDLHAALTDELPLTVRSSLPPCAYGFLRSVDIPHPLLPQAMSVRRGVRSAPHDEATIAILTGIGDALAQAHVDPASVMPVIEPLIAATTELRRRLQEQGLRTEAIGAAVAEGVAELLRE